MKNKTLIDFISKNFNITTDEINHIDSIFLEKTLHKGQLLLSRGEYCKKISFINTGLVRYYYINNNSIEYTKYFCFENDFIIDISSVIENRKSNLYIECLEDTNICTASINDFMKLKETNTTVSNIYLVLLERSYIAKENREAELLLYDATRRYLNFIKNDVNIENRINQHHIASYLGIKPETLSRIRNKLIDKSQ